jgi:Helix-turn-helix domain
LWAACSGRRLPTESYNLLGAPPGASGPGFSGPGGPAGPVFPWSGPLAWGTLGGWVILTNRLTPGSAVMDDTPCRRFFREPATPLHRQYEALRAVFLDGLPQQEVAGRFGYSYDALRQLVHQFRHGCAAGTPAPFFSNRAPDDRPPQHPRPQPGRSRRPSPTPAP